LLAGCKFIQTSIFFFLQKILAVTVVFILLVVTCCEIAQLSFSLPFIYIYWIKLLQKGFADFPTDVLSDGHTVGDSVWRQIPIGHLQILISALDDFGHFQKQEKSQSEVMGKISWFIE